MPVTRLAALDDGAALSALVTAHREALAPWEPRRDDEWFTLDRQRAFAGGGSGRVRPGGQGPAGHRGRRRGDRPVDAQRGDPRCAAVGVDRLLGEPGAAGRGFATAALAEAVGLAFGEMALLRLQAETLLHNTASQQVLVRNGFRPYGVAPSDLRIAGRWQDHILFHRLAEENE